MGKKQGSISSFFQPIPSKAHAFGVGDGLATDAKDAKAEGQERSTLVEDGRPAFVERVRSTRGFRSQRVEPDPPHAAIERITESPARRNRKRVLLESEEGSDVEKSDLEQVDTSPAVQIKVDNAVARNKLLGQSQLDEGSEDPHAPEKEWTQRNEWTVEIRDAAGRLQSDPDYDCTTLRIPSKAYDKLTPFQKQYWDIKRTHFDVILMFKKGKFYEMYDRDADIGASVLDLNYTGGGRVDMRCVGVPESTFARHAARLAEAGYKVGRVDQTETFNAAKKRRTSSEPSAKSQICERALVKILTKGTINEDGVLSAHQSRYLLAIKEQVESGDGDERARIGVCFVDVAANAIHVGEFEDDHKRTWLETLVELLQPQEIIVNAIDTTSDRLTRALSFYKTQGTQIVRAPGAAPDVHDAVPVDIRSYFDDGHPLAAMATGICRQYLSYLKIEKEVFSLGNFKTQSIVGYSFTEKSALDDVHLILDAETLSNLDILVTSSDRSERGALISYIDRTVTPDGKRLIRHWLAKPLYSSKAIIDRQNAVAVFGDVSEQFPSEYREMRSQLSHLPDIERCLAKIHATAAKEDKVVMFDDTNKRKVVEFVQFLNGLKSALEIRAQLQPLVQRCGADKSNTLSWLLAHDGCISKGTDAALSFFLNDVLDMDAAAKGEVVPLLGEHSNPEYRRAVERMRDADQNLEDELDRLKKRLGLQQLTWFHRGKEGYQVEVPMSWLDRGNTVPSEFTCLSQSPKCKRYWTPKIQQMYHARTEAAEELEIEDKSVFQRVLVLFDEKHGLWSSLGKVMAEVDALMSLVSVSRQSVSQMCRPEILPNNGDSPVLILEQSRHPLVADRMGSNAVSSFVPNDITLGGEEAPAVLLTGPNMGGKSTVLRQTCLAVILAQIGCHVPAARCVLSPVDRIFTRIGAHDRITRGQSTFMVEMEETALLLNCASRQSLLVLDELGRGTSTFDGYAIAYAVLDEISQRHCRTMFSTHYHMLTEEFACNDRVAEYEMAAKVDEERNDVTFLYKFVRGVAPFSRGIHCARMARIPDKVAESAEKYAALLETSIADRLNETRRTRAFASVEAACRLPGEKAKDMLKLLCTPEAT